MSFLHKLRRLVVSRSKIILRFAALRLAVFYVVVLGSVVPGSHNPGFGTRRCLTKFTFRLSYLWRYCLLCTFRHPYFRQYLFLN